MVPDAANADARMKPLTIPALQTVTLGCKKGMLKFERIPGYRYRIR